MIHPSPDPDPPALALAELALALRRRWRLVVGLPVLVLALSLVLRRPAERTFQARLTAALDIPRSALVVGSDKGDAANTGEALIDDISRILPGDAFTAAVAKRLPPSITMSGPGPCEASSLAGSLSADDRHRVTDISVTRCVPGSATADQVLRTRHELAVIGQAVVEELTQNGNSWFARLGDQDVVVTIVDGPKVVELPQPARVRLDLPLRALLALVFAVGLAVLWHLVDPRLYGAAEALAAAQAPLLGILPRRS